MGRERDRLSRTHRRVFPSVYFVLASEFLSLFSTFGHKSGHFSRCFRP